ncbi:hypothetical protein BDC45DRAFT_561330 [Circinella umbellata]|nr:hypothetical protein BDC45DRAFT_561330 [Circinella umbellata]
MESVNENKCPTCQQKQQEQVELIEQLRHELKIKDDAMERLRQDMDTLNQKYVAGINRVADVQYEKDLVEHELEELSTRLFEEANNMVAEEKRQRYLLEQELQQTQEHLMAEQNQLQELRERIQQQSSFSSSSSSDENKDPNISRARHDLQQLYNTNCKRASANNHNLYKTSFHKQQQQRLLREQQGQRATSMPPLPSAIVQKENQQKNNNNNNNKSMSIDQVQLEAFREFVRSSPKVAFKKLNQFVYMKVCQQEDVEPCLRFGPHSRLSVKKMNEFLSRQPCFIEQHDGDAYNSLTINTNVPSAVMARPLWDRFSSNNNNNNNVQNHNQQQLQQQSLQYQCSACGRPADKQALSYRFRLDEMDKWAVIDQYCRDRLVAVCEFYVFIRNIQKGFYADRDIDDLYTENIRLRLQMFYSRMGALPVILDGMGLDPGSVGKATPPLDTIPDDASDASISTAPQTPITQTAPSLKEEYIVHEDNDSHHLHQYHNGNNHNHHNS